MKSKKITLPQVDSKVRHRALEGFRDLLNSKTTEADWQKFFDENPFIFSDVFSVKLDGLYSQVPLDTGIPDYVFYGKTGNKYGRDFGVIELKRPEHSIIGTYSSKIIVPSKHLRVAQQQVSLHLDAIQRGRFINSDDFFVAGNRKYAFIIMGMTKEITTKCQEEFLRMQFNNFLIHGFHLYTYDEVLDLFSSSVPPLVQVLFVSSASAINEEVSRTVRINRKYGMDAPPSARLSMLAQHFISDIYLKRGHGKVDAKSIMGVMMLAAGKGTIVEIIAKGYDAETAVEAIGNLIESDFYYGDDQLSGMDEEYQKFVKSVASIVPVTSSQERKMIEEAAYYEAEKDGFQKTPEHYWYLGKEIIKGILKNEYINILKDKNMKKK